jgi:hypothetical protein
MSDERMNPRRLPAAIFEKATLPAAWFACFPFTPASRRFAENHVAMLAHHGA